MSVCLIAVRRRLLQPGNAPDMLTAQTIGGSTPMPQAAAIVMGRGVVKVAVDAALCWH